MISVIMAHYRREELLFRTLWGYRHLHAPEVLDNVEFVIVDDDGGHSELFWKVIKLHSCALNITAAAMYETTKFGAKTHNTSGPMNFGIKLAIGDLFVLTNPENIPMVPDLLTKLYAEMDGNENRHLSGNCYSLDKSDTGTFKNVDFTDKIEFLHAIGNFIPFKNVPFGENGASSGWRQHSQYQAVRYFFLSAIWRDPLFKMGGFDENFLEGQGGEDMDFVSRAIKMGMEMFHTDNLVVLHQFHFGPGSHKLHPQRRAAVSINIKTRIDAENSTRFVANTGKDWGHPKSACNILIWHK